MPSALFDYYLKFDSQEQANSVIDPYRSDVMNVAIDELGTLYDSVDTGEIDEYEQPIITHTPKEGYYVNVRSRYEIDFGSYEIFPDSPTVKFAE